MKRAAIVLVVAVFFSGCRLSEWARNGFKVGPDYCEPAVPVADNWIDSDDPRVLEQPPKYADWWSDSFRDPVLNDLVRTASLQNLTLREAGQRVLAARAQRAITAGSLFPQLQQFTGNYTRAQLGTVSQPFVEPVPGKFSRAFDAWSLGGNLAWELDVWGRFRRSIEAADANLDVSVDNYDAVLVSLIAEVVTAYVDIRTFEQRLAYARQNVQIQEGSLELTQTRFDEGKTPEISVHLSKSNLESTRATIPSLQIGRRQAGNRLCTLLGIPTTDLSALLGTGGIPVAPAEVAVGIPADLVRRRPDVRAAERQVAVQSALIGVAVSDLYPRISVTGQITVSAEQFRDLFSSAAQGGAIGPSFQWNVLNYGRIVNNVRVQEARFLEFVAAYQNTVLTAGQEVEDGLVAFLRTQEQVQSLAASVLETQLALELQLIRFQEGESDFTGVFVLQADLAIKQDQLAAAQGQVPASLVSVYKALGGGWEIRLVNAQPDGIVRPLVEELPPPAGDAADQRAAGGDAGGGAGNFRDDGED